MTPQPPGRGPQIAIQPPDRPGSPKPAPAMGLFAHADIDDLTQAVQETYDRAFINGRNSLMTTWTVVIFFFETEFIGLQTRHRWPVLSADIAYTVAAVLVVFTWSRIYRGRG